MDLGLKDKVIIVTGGFGGFRDDIGRVLSAEGAIVAEYATLTAPETCKETIEQVVHKYGRIDGLVNSASVKETAEPELTNTKWFTENLPNVLVYDYLMTHFALPFLKITKGPIINISLKVTESGQDNMFTHAAVQGGLNALTREWAVELLKYGIRVNAVTVCERNRSPYEFQPQSLSIPDENMTAAHAVAFLLSGKSSHTTGQLIRVNRVNATQKTTAVIA